MRNLNYESEDQMRTTNQIIEDLKEKYALNEWECDLIKKLRQQRPKLHTQLNHVSNSGMFRLISVKWIKNGDYLTLDYLVSKVTGYKQDNKRNGLRVTGCGMDMGFAVVYDFSNVIFPDRFKYRKNEWHRNNDPSPIDRNGGYASKQAWL